ncbi:Hypothetical protein A7982_06903 [Minicystis rosea]|nr:Hypothetical protein A7982_06903 [Minicystis rosea]
MVEQQALSVGLVLRAGTIELGGMEDLAGIVNGHAEPNEIGIHTHLHASKRIEDRLRGLADQTNMGDETSRRAETTKESVGLHDGSR